MRAAAALALCGGACAAASQVQGAVPAVAPQAAYPAAECAALWLGTDDYAARSPFLGADPGRARVARGFRAVAVQLNGGDARPVDRLIARQRRYWAQVNDAFIRLGDADARDLYTRQLRLCDAYAATRPETRDDR